MSKPADDVRFDHVIALFREDAQCIARATGHVLAGAVTYNGEIGDHMPQEILVDTQTRTLRVLFNDGAEKKICDLSPGNVETVGRFYQDLKSTRADMLEGDKVDIGFYQANAAGELKGKKYLVTARFV